MPMIRNDTRREHNLMVRHDCEPLLVVSFSARRKQKRRLLINARLCGTAIYSDDENLLSNEKFGCATGFWPSREGHGFMPCELGGGALYFEDGAPPPTWRHLYNSDDGKSVGTPQENLCCMVT